MNGTNSNKKGCEVIDYTLNTDTKKYIFKPENEEECTEVALKDHLKTRRLLVACEMYLSRSVYGVLNGSDDFWDRTLMDYIGDLFDAISECFNDPKYFQTVRVDCKPSNSPYLNLSIFRAKRGPDFQKLFKDTLESVFRVSPRLLSERAMADIQKILSRIDAYLACIHLCVNGVKPRRGGNKPPASYCKDESVSGAVAGYKQQLRKYGTEKYVAFTTDYDITVTKLACLEINPRNLPPRFFEFRNGFYQYELVESGPYIPKLQDRLIAAKLVPFLDRIGNVEDYMVLDLCHNPQCMEWTHHVLVRNNEISDRLTCPGKPGCRHQPRCLIPGLMITL